MVAPLKEDNRMEYFSQLLMGKVIKFFKGQKKNFERSVSCNQ